MRQALATEFGLDEIKHSFLFNHQTMTLAGCKCADCRDWKTQSKNRVFWRVKT